MDDAEVAEAEVEVVGCSSPPLSFQEGPMETSDPRNGALCESNAMDTSSSFWIFFENAVCSLEELFPIQGFRSALSNGF